MLNLRFGHLRRKFGGLDQSRDRGRHNFVGYQQNTSKSEECLLVYTRSASFPNVFLKKKKYSVKLGAQDFKFDVNIEREQRCLG